ncbi:tetratricopeptide repeat protein [Kovacikia minuta CCNUW1]|uniref:tetratricopeptide repeat protein n=1 Tax=Kovacikia minuta TaxID=2931930 RepID=UPI001CCF017B|nr:tetratricopeptide repeat protein [Kovacikia minuta]UBF25857.1 tetratricopeptide repeat protein [Kovacikia minuta CCNUW1]
MLDEVAAAFDRQDYPTASRLLKELLKQSPENPWVQLYAARLQEVSGKLDPAEEIYRQLLRNATNPKLAAQARQGIQRVESSQRELRRQAIEQATADPGNSEPGFLVLESVTGENRAIAIQNFSRIMKLDAYTGRLLLPNRGWRLYRTGTLGELQVYGQMLCDAGVPAFWASLAQLQKLQVFRVSHLKSLVPKATVVCRNERDQLGSLTFDWSEVSHWVEGMVPVFERVVTLGYRDRLERREETQDYDHLCDLHLPGRQCILRLHDSHYAFHSGVPVVPPPATPGKVERSTNRTNWNHLMELLQRQLSHAAHWSDFTPFAETAADFAIPLRQITHHIHVFRQSDSYWDAAFQLYSGLIFLRGSRADDRSPVIGDRG